MKRILVFLTAFCLALTATGAVAEEPSPDYTTGTPWICADLAGAVTEDTPAELKDNFYLYCNRDALLKTEIPAGYSFGGFVMDLVQKRAANMKSLFAEADPQTHDEKLAVDLYDLLMDWTARNAMGVRPLKEAVDRVDAIDTLDAMTSYLTKTPPEDQIAPLIQFHSETSQVDATVKDMSVLAPDLLMQDSSEYSALSDYGRIRQEAYGEFTRKMLVKLGYSAEEAEKKLDNCLAFEHLVAPSIPTGAERQHPDFFKKLLENTVSRETLARKAGAFPLLAMIEENAGYPEAERYVLQCGDYLTRLAEVYTEENLDLIRDYLIVHGIRTHATVLDRESYEWRMEADNKVTGSSGILDDETAFSSMTNSLLQWPVAQLYCRVYVHPDDKVRLTALVNQAVETYHDILNGADFLSSETRTKAIEKLDAMSINVLYPDDWSAYSMEELSFASPAEGGTLWDARKAIRAFNTAKDAKEFNEPVNKSLWTVSPAEVNCFYEPAVNGMFICGAFAQGNMYNSGMKDEQLLAGIGTVIGHEISHAFDSSGSQYDKDGNLANWWTDEDYAAFQQKVQKLADYYSAKTAWDGMPYNGAIVTGETCADMGGLKCMLLIAKEKESFDYDLFFRSHAGIWLNKSSLPRILTLMRDVHPLGSMRCNSTLQQFDEFLDFYGITEGDLMYLAPEDRVSIW